MLKRTVLDRSFAIETIATELFISERMVDYFQTKRPELNGRTIQMFIRALSQPYDSIQYPEDWWQSFKSRWFPCWLEKKFPVKMTVKTFARYCPHVRVPENETHIRWLEREGNDGEAIEGVRKEEEVSGSRTR